MSHPLYASGKQALITTMKHFVKQNIRNLSFSGFKLGCMDINHKYMHKLRLEDNDKFNNILNEEVPSGHFTKPEEVAQWVLDSHCNPHLSNGMIADISGGNSWLDFQINKLMQKGYVVVPVESLKKLSQIKTRISSLLRSECSGLEAKLGEDEILNNIHKYLPIESDTDANDLVIKIIMKLKSGPRFSK